MLNLTENYAKEHRIELLNYWYAITHYPRKVELSILETALQMKLMSWKMTLESKEQDTLKETVSWCKNSGLHIHH